MRDIGPSWIVSEGYFALNLHCVADHSLSDGSAYCPFPSQPTTASSFLTSARRYPV
jgi:hypothetical protein